MYLRNENYNMEF